jgi:acyl-CoA reductase-like NAD-dependent aldehyde dehydrogenase
MSKFLFNGRWVEGNKPDPQGPYMGDALEEMFRREDAAAAADQRALQAAQIAWAEQVKRENRAIARLIGKAFEEESK